MAVKTSKNSKKGSPIKEVFKVKRVKPKKEFILVELTPTVTEEIKSDLSVYKNKPIVDIVKRYGKQYLKVLNN